MFLVIDVGNTNIVFAICIHYKNKLKILHKFRIKTDVNRTSDEYSYINNYFFTSKKLSISDLKGVCIASVVPEAVYSLEVFIEKSVKKPLIFIDEKKN